MRLFSQPAFFFFVITSPLSSAGEFNEIFPSGAELDYAGTVTNSGVPRAENRRIVFTTSTNTLNGTYTYAFNGEKTGVLRHLSRFESGGFSEVEDSRIKLTFETPTSGTYTSSGTFEGEDGSGAFAGTFTSSGNFQVNAPDVSRAPSVLEDFNDGLKDASLWGTDTAGTDTGSTEAVFEECNGRLEFHTQDTDFQEILRPLISGKPRYGENWEVTVDLSNRFAPETELPEAAIGLRIVSPADPTDFLETALLGYRGRSEIVNPAYSVLGNGVEQFALINSNFAALRVQFDSVRKQLHCDYDADGAVNGYSWTRFATYGINGSSGHTADADWAVAGESQEFGVFLYSYRIGGSDADGLVSLDDFRSSIGRHVTGETLEEWLVRNFGSSGVPEAALDFDGDLDGLANLAEYAFGTSPEVFNPAGGTDVSGGAPGARISATADFPRLEISYTRRTVPSGGLVYQPQFNSGLDGGWEDSTEPERVFDLGGGFERVTVSDHVQGSPAARFGRVRVSKDGD